MVTLLLLLLETKLLLPLLLIVPCNLLLLATIASFFTCYSAILQQMLLFLQRSMVCCRFSSRHLYEIPFEGDAFWYICYECDESPPPPTNPSRRRGFRVRGGDGFDFYPVTTAR